MIKLWLPWPPSISGYTNVVNGRKIKSAKARAWFKAAGAVIQSQKQKPITGPVEVHYLFVRANKRKFDHGNKYKCIDDALVKSGLIEDDNIDIISKWSGGWRWAEEGEEGKVEIQICPLQLNS